MPDYGTLTQTLGTETTPQDAALYRPRFNIAPADLHWIVTEGERERRLLPAKWGISNRFRPGDSFINARLETAAEKPTFRGAFRNRRCVIPADGFYEWKKEGRTKRPYWFHAADRSLFLFAGLFEKEPELSFTILTTAADPVVSPVHDRMPVILGVPSVDLWIHETRIGPSVGLESRPVSLRVNSAKNDDADCLEVDAAALADRIPRYP